MHKAENGPATYLKDIGGSCIGSSADAEILLEVVAETSCGEEVRVVGGADFFGSWEPARGVALSTGPDTYPLWQGRVPLPRLACLGRVDDACGVEYKFVISRPDGSAAWEPGCNRVLALQFEEGTEEVAGANPGKSSPASWSRFGDTTSEVPGAKCRVAFDKRVAVDRSLSESTLAASGSLNTLPTIASAATLPICLESCASSSTLCREDTELVLASPSSSRSLWLRCGAHRMQKPGGPCEDAYFHSVHAMGVADGVGQMSQWADRGVDASAYATELMRIAANELHMPGTSTSSDAAAASMELPPDERAVAAVAAAEARAETFGASTITVLALEGSDVGVANLGDSGFMLLRAKPWGYWKIEESSRDQSHGWNCPYQLTRVPQSVATEVAANGRRVVLDTADDCQRYRVSVQPGDMLLMFTDGLTDNIHWHEIVKAVDDAFDPDHDIGDWDCSEAALEKLAQSLVSAAHRQSRNPEADTPFARTARQNRQHQPGGKEDDITVVAALVMQQGSCLWQEGCAIGSSGSVTEPVVSSRLSLP